MLNGIDPIIIFNFKKLPETIDTTTSLPIVGSEGTSLPFSLPAIPIYLSEKITGILIDSEDRNIDVDTTITTTLPNVKQATFTNQRPLNSSVTINMVASRGSLGITLLSALAELALPKLTSKEYSITYLHGAVTVFEGLLHNFAISQNSGDDLYRITLGLIKPPPEPKKDTVVQVKRLSTDALPGTGAAFTSGAA